MFKTQIFLGFPVDKLYAAELDKVNPNLFSQYVNESDDFLNEIVYKEIRYFGKNLGKIVTLQQLELFEKNIYSILTKLVPNYPYDETPLYIFPFDQAST